MSTERNGKKHCVKMDRTLGESTIFFNLLNWELGMNLYSLVLCVAGNVDFRLFSSSTERNGKKHWVKMDRTLGKLLIATKERALYSLTC